MTRKKSIEEFPRRISMVAFRNVEILDVTGPLEVFALASSTLQTQGGGCGYEVEILAEQAGEVRTSSGLRLVADASWQDRNSADTLLVAGGPGVDSVPVDLVEWLKKTAPQVRRIGSICTGAFILARTGLLNGRRATTHWSAAEKLRQEYPSVQVEQDAIYTRDKNIYTSAGITAGMDLALAMVEEDYGRELALYLSRILVLYYKRPGGQSQFSTILRIQSKDEGPLTPLLVWVRERFRGELTVQILAEQAAMSLRNFARVFVRETGMTPARYVEMVRLEEAVRLLEGSGFALEAVARECGFVSADNLRRSFQRHFGVSPGEYRERFQASSVN
jgi:transcriptional regulator GlxA family with amidase domain